MIYDVTPVYIPTKEEAREGKEEYALASIRVTAQTEDAACFRAGMGYGEITEKWCQIQLVVRPFC